MNTKTISKMKTNFENKVCTIFTKQVCKSFVDHVWREHYAVRVTEISSDGIWAEHPYNGTVSFFNLEHVIFIQEEIELDPSNPIHSEMIKEYEKQTGKKIISDVSPHLAPKIEDDVEETKVEEKNTESDINPDSVFVDIESLTKLAESTKKQQLNVFNILN